jgi:hypothetical protein
MIILKMSGPALVLALVLAPARAQIGSVPRRYAVSFAAQARAVVTCGKLPFGV